jgi:ABC-type glycerol-3-phosphate transport system substrate-binding protein
MSIKLSARSGRSARRVALLGACAAVLAACGTPATVTPVNDPLPGFSRAIKDAHNAAQQASNDSNGEASTNLTVPTVTTPYQGAQNAVQQASNDSNGEASTNLTVPTVTTP